MAEILSFSIDLSKIDKSRIKEVTKKDGSIGKYYGVTVTINDEQDQYGNIASMADEQTKEERENKAKRNYLCNGKRVWSSNPTSTQNTVSQQAPDASTLPSEDNQDLPF